MREQYIAWLYETQIINNGEMLIQKLEDADLQIEFIDEYGLDEDVEL